MQNLYFYENAQTFVIYPVSVSVFIICNYLNILRLMPGQGFPFLMPGQGFPFLMPGQGFHFLMPGQGFHFLMPGQGFHFLMPGQQWCRVANKWQKNMKWFVSSIPWLHRHLPEGVSMKLWHFLWYLKELKPTLSWKRYRSPKGSCTPKIHLFLWTNQR